jgi:hypothetical protein
MVLLQMIQRRIIIKNTSVSIKTITSFIFMGLAMALQEAYSFTDGNNTVHTVFISGICKFKKE